RKLLDAVQLRGDVSRVDRAGWRAACVDLQGLRTPMQRAFGLEIPETLADACLPSRTALIVYDMQVGVLRQIANAEMVTSRVGEVLRAARLAGIRVVFTRHLSMPRELMGVFQLRMAMAWQRVSTVDEIKPRFLRDAPGFQLAPELSPLPSEAVVDKI